MSKTVRLTAILCFVLSTSFLRAGEAKVELAVTNSANAAVLQKVGAILQNLRFTHYNHKTAIEEKAGSYNVDCSGLARFILRETDPAALEVLPREPGWSFPRAVSFYSAFTNIASARVTTYWKPIARFDELEPGDFIAWRKIHIEKGDNSGHVMLVMEKPTREINGRFRVKVLDSSNGKHAEDSRAKDQTGIGTGVMWFGVDSEQKPVSFFWSGASLPKKCPIAIGRALLEK